MGTAIHKSRVSTELFIKYTSWLSLAEWLDNRLSSRVECPDLLLNAGHYGQIQRLLISQIRRQSCQR
jgi:hypothetical protein